MLEKESFYISRELYKPSLLPPTLFPPQTECLHKLN